MAQKTKSGSSRAKAGTSSASGARNRKKTSAAGSAAGSRSSSSGKRTSGGRKTAAGGRASTSRTTSSRSSSARRAKAVQKARQNTILREREVRMGIALVVMVVAMVLIYLSLAGFCGSVGSALSRILFGSFGIGAWVIPVWVFVLCLYLIAQAGGRQMPARLLAGAILILILQSAAHLYLHTCARISLDAPFDAGATFKFCSENSLGGGIFGGWFSRLLYRAFGVPGSILVYLGIAASALMLLIQRSPASIARSWREYREEEGIPAFSERQAMRRARRQQELEEAEERRLSREADRILRRQERAADRALQREQDGQLSGRKKKRRGTADPLALNLENTLLQGENTGGRPSADGSGISSASSQKSGRTGRGASGRIVDLDRRKDVHEIIVLPEDEGELMTAAGTGTSSAAALAGAASLAGASSLSGTVSYDSPFGDDSPSPGPVHGYRSFEDDQAEYGAFAYEIPTVPAASAPASEAAAPGSGHAAVSGSTGGLPGLPDAAAPGSTGSSISGKPDGTVPLRTDTGLPGGSAATVSTAKGTDLPGIGAAASSEDTGRTVHGGAGGSVSGSAGFSTPSEEDLQGISVHRESGDAKTGSRTSGPSSAVRKANSYIPPTFTLLDRGKSGKNEETERELKETAYRLQETLRTFGVQVTITDISQGPSVTRYELKPDKGVKVSRIVNLSDDIKLRLAATDIRIEAPIPGKSAIGIEVPNKKETIVCLRDLLATEEFRSFKGRLPFAVGKDIGGKNVIADIARMPHLLIAGATGSGKSVCINTIILSILYRTTPDQVRLLMIDPKVVELSVYKKIPHLIIPVVTDPRKASAALNWAVAEMEKRYKLFAAAGARDLNGYNAMAESWRNEDGEPEREPLPRIVIIVDELADLMMVAKSEVESAICRLAQLARAAGIHLIIATQRPSVDVITGLIKANMPSRIAFAVSSQVDSRTILDMAGAEKLIGRGDMLFYPQNYQKPARIQGAFVSDDEVTRVVDYIKKNNTAEAHDQEIDRQIDDIAANGISAMSSGEVKADPGRDEHFAEAGRFIIEKNKASIGLLQRVFKIGFNRAARIMDQLAEAGVVSEESSTRARQVLMTMPEFEAFLESENG